VRLLKLGFRKAAYSPVARLRNSRSGTKLAASLDKQRARAEEKAERNAERAAQRRASKGGKTSPTDAIETSALKADTR
jgi:hypothetical protein